MAFSMVGLTQRCGMLQVSRANNDNGIQQANPELSISRFKNSSAPFQLEVS